MVELEAGMGSLRRSTAYRRVPFCRDQVLRVWFTETVKRRGSRSVIWFEGFGVYMAEEITAENEILSFPCRNEPALIHGSLFFMNSR